ncbi:hypothetical protein CEXT_552091 [Caerostris extrusa]|uniref:Uncharacterized protein n=1 Tax=Caerostris extrusa TaxID=172846 RepID=A0AAV4X6X1_CAEEX|nr:hypothetical protein CEXT_552091 [Caerostris extrusa]
MLYQRPKVSRHVNSPHQQYHIVSQRSTDINVHHLFPIIRLISPLINYRRPLLTLARSITHIKHRAKTVADELIKNLISSFGFPIIITIVQKTQYESYLFWNYSNSKIQKTTHIGLSSTVKWFY